MLFAETETLLCHCYLVISNISTLQQSIYIHTHQTPVISILSNPGEFTRRLQSVLHEHNFLLWELQLSRNTFHKALIKIYLTFQPQLFRAIRPIVLQSSLCPKTAVLFCSQLTQMDRKKFGRRGSRTSRMHQSFPFPLTSYWDLFIRNLMQIDCYSWAFLTQGTDAGVLFGLGRLKLLMRAQRRVNLINHVD